MKTKLKMLALFGAMVGALALQGCKSDEDRINIGAKSFGENRVLAHMVADLAKERGLPVGKVVEISGSQAIMDGLRRGDISLYPEYNGTGMVLVGQNPSSNGAEMSARLTEIYEPLGLSWGPKFGFANNYGLAMDPDRAAELGITKMSDLVAVAGTLKIGAEEDFRVRPIDGLWAMNRRYGLAFGTTTIVSIADRLSLYDALQQNKVDVIEVFTTDGQITDLGLTVLPDDLGFFPVYEATTLARKDAISAHPELAEVLQSLEGKISAEMMRELNRMVEIDGRSPKDVAKIALNQIGLLPDAAVSTDEPVRIAASALMTEGPVSAASLRAVRAAFPGRRVELTASTAPLAALAAGEARVALVGAESFFDVGGEEVVRVENSEAVVAVDQGLIHLVGRTGVTDLASATGLVTGPEGSSTHRIAVLLQKGLGLKASIKPAGSEDLGSLLAAIPEGSGDVAVVTLPLADATLTKQLQAGTSLKLVPVAGWTSGANLIRYPFLRPARIPAGTYPGQVALVETLSSQLVLAGPVVSASLVGGQGPNLGLATPAQVALSDESVRAISGAVAGATLIDPTLRQSQALTSGLVKQAKGISTAVDVMLVNLCVILFFTWLIILYVRREEPAT